jgi:hypothetical protein
MSIADALSRISQIQQQIEQLQTGTLPTTTAATSATGTSDASVGTTGTASSAATTSFSDALAQATGTTAGAFPDAADNFSTTTGGLSTLTGSSSTGATGGAALPVAASSMLTSDQQQFASQLAADTGLNPGVVSAWVLAEESGGAAQARQAAGNNDWLNIGYTDSATYGSGDSIWSDPTTAANATAGWLQGQQTIPGYGAASSGIQSILSTAGQTPAAQIAALQSSGWASSGYPDLPSLYTQVTA